MSREAFKDLMRRKAIAEATRLPSIAEDVIKCQLDSVTKAESNLYLMGFLFLLNEGDNTVPDWPKIDFELSYMSKAGTAASVTKRADFAAVDAVKLTYKLVPELKTLSPALSELILAAHATDLKQSHIKTWAQSHGVPTDAAEVLKSWLPTMTRKIPVEAVVDAAEVTTWLNYRLTSQSTATLCRIAFEGLGPASTFVFDKNEAAAIKDASPYALSSGIPQSAIAKAYVYLDTVGYNFGAWYQGRKAIAVWSVAEAVKFRTVIAESIKRKVAKETLDLAKTAEEVIALAGLTPDAAHVRSMIEQAREEKEAWEAAVKYLSKKGMSAASVPEGVSPQQVADAIGRITQFEGDIQKILGA